MTEEYKTTLLQGIANYREKMVNGRPIVVMSSTEKLLALLADAVQALVLESKPKE